MTEGRTLVIPTHMFHTSLTSQIRSMAQQRSGTSARSPEERSTTATDDNDCAAQVEERLHDIAAALGGREVGANSEEFWFRSDVGDGVEIRLGWNVEGRSYDRSLNFAISYSTGPSQATGATLDDVLAAVVDRIRSVDDTRLDNVVNVFGVAAGNAVKRFSATWEDRAETRDNDSDVTPDVVVEGRVSSASDPPAAVAEQVHVPDPWWERRQTRKLNVVFLDMCARLMSGTNQALSPLHWGFWPADGQSVAADFDPFWAFSENLLAYIPHGVGRVMDIGCGLGANTRLLADKHFRVTAVTPVAHHADLIDQAKLSRVDVRCARFEEMHPEEPYDLLLFSESMNHFPLTDEFLGHCKTFLQRNGFMLIADDLTEERACRIEEQRVFRVLRSVDISKNVEPTSDWWVRQKRAIAAYGAALMSILEMHDPAVAARVQQILEDLDSTELRMLLSDEESIPSTKGRYMIYLLQRD